MECLVNKMLVMPLMVFGLGLSFSRTEVNPPELGPGTRRYSSVGNGSESGNGIITGIDEENWKQLLTGEWLFLLCSECQELQLVLHQLATTSTHCLAVKLAIAELIDLPVPSTLRRRFSAFDRLTLYHVLDENFRLLSSEQDSDSLLDLILRRDWEHIKPEPFFKHPTSVWIEIPIFAYKIAVILVNTGYFGTDHRIITYTICFLLAGCVTYGVYGINALYSTLFTGDDYFEETVPNPPANTLQYEEEEDDEDDDDVYGDSIQDDHIEYWVVQDE
ncbi:uncharacterized protein LOC108048466 [Drosophila rhopaloa]|uniref:Uncharacterized protein LOC108048466 n=1 Tax=Drosophila rhopaloa TaxID=1041015 RepID=A0A6P4F6E5_DRORH|nr:uncharacterized protein LOC108048466 [Drosophila rhopaloa]